MRRFSFSALRWTVTLTAMPLLSAAMAGCTEVPVGKEVDSDAGPTPDPTQDGSVAVVDTGTPPNPSQDSSVIVADAAVCGLMIDDMERAPVVPGGGDFFWAKGPIGNWFYLKKGDAAPFSIDPPREDSAHARRVVGTAGNGLRVQLKHPGGQPVDLSGYAGISFFAKAKAGYSPFAITTPPGGGLQVTIDEKYTQEVAITQAWQNITLPFAGFRAASGEALPKPSAATIDFAMAADTFDLWIDDLGLVCSLPETSWSCTKADCAGKPVQTDAVLCPDHTALGRTSCKRSAAGVCAPDFPECPAGCGCVPDIQWGLNGGLVAYQDQSSVTACFAYSHNRTVFVPSDAGAGPSCRAILVGCPSGVYGTDGIVQRLENPDVQNAIQKKSVVYGKDQRPADGTVFRIEVMGAVIDVGAPCDGAAGCIEIPPGVKDLVNWLDQIDRQELPSEPCASAFPGH